MTSSLAMRRSACGLLFYKNGPTMKYTVCPLRCSHRFPLISYAENGTVPLSDLKDVVSATDCRNDNLFRMRMPQLDDESCHAARPGSAHTFGSTNCWPSDTDSPRLSQEPSTVESRVDSIVQKRPAEMQSLMICDASKVEDFLVRALRTMQQLAVKRIAKAWIKGICPRKQAVFPYNNKKKKRGDGIHDTADNPGWWPDESLCVFVEPDHIKRDGKSYKSHLSCRMTDWDRTRQPMSSSPAPEANASTTEGMEQRHCRTSSDACDQRLDRVPQRACSSLNLRRSERARR